MASRDAGRMNNSLGEEVGPVCFSDWFKRRRQELHLTQEQLAKNACCSVFAIRKIEMGDRRPSSQLAGLLAKALEIAAEDQSTFIKVARGELNIERLDGIAHSARPVDQSGIILGNLPKVLTPFFGREPELAALGQLLADPQCSLLTIVGPGGIGKTRLAIEAARYSQNLFPDGVWFASLAALNSPTFLLQAIADAVDFKFQNHTNTKAQLFSHLRSKRALIILDNAEHLLEGVGLFTEMLRDCQLVKLLVTSRERLNLLSEWVFEIQGLPLPASDQVEQFEAFSSVALFFQSARRVQAGFEIRPDERQWVLKICQAVEGLPLGIELSAAWVGLLSCEEIAREIGRNLAFLSVSMRDIPERHRSLRATLDHSWNLLNSEEQLILSRLSVFRGSFDREAAQEICGASLVVLSSLRDKSLLHRMDQDHYALHEMIRQYAELKLADDPDENERVKDRHSAYYVRCLSEWEKALQSSRQVETFNEMARVIDNLSRGWQRMLASFQPKTLKSGQFRRDLFHSSLFSLSLFYEMRNRSFEALAIFKESLEHLKSIQNAFEKTGDCSTFYAVLGHTTAYLGLHHLTIFQYEQGCRYLEEAIVWLEKAQSRIVRAQAQVMLSAAYHTQGQLQVAAALEEESREVFREEGERWWYLLSTINLAPTYVSLGKVQESDTLLQEALDLVEPGDFRLGFPLRNNSSYVANLRGDLARAERLLQENLLDCNQYGTIDQTSDVLFELGRVALASHQMELAEGYFQESIDILSETGLLVDLSRHRIFLGKCLTARPDRQAARDQFRLVIRQGQEQNRPFLVFWGLANIANTYLEDGQTERALEMALALRHCPVEYIRIKEEGDRLLANLRANLPQSQFEAAMKQVDSQIAPEQVEANALAYALKRGME